MIHLNEIMLCVCKKSSLRCLVAHVFPARARKLVHRLLFTYQRRNLLSLLRLGTTKQLKLTIIVQVQMQGDTSAGKFTQNLLCFAEGKLSVKLAKLCSIVTTTEELKNSAFRNILPHNTDCSGLCE
jgi:hypothetical protein